MKKITILIALLPMLMRSGYAPAPKPLAITLQPLGEIPATYTSYVHATLAHIIPTLVILPAIPLPKTAFYKPRSRYRADSLVNFLSRHTPRGSITIGLTEKDISCTSGKYPDWGIFGLSECPGKACVASSFRSKNNKAKGLYFTAIHELGHCMGLEHCPDKGCLMQDACGGTIKAQVFCPLCKTFLRAKGWKL